MSFVRPVPAQNVENTDWSTPRARLNPKVMASADLFKYSRIRILPFRHITSNISIRRNKDLFCIGYSTLNVDHQYFSDAASLPRRMKTSFCYWLEIVKKIKKKTHTHTHLLATTRKRTADGLQPCSRDSGHPDIDNQIMYRMFEKVFFLRLKKSF